MGFNIDCFSNLNLNAGHMYLVAEWQKLKEILKMLKQYWQLTLKPHRV